MKVLGILNFESADASIGGLSDFRTISAVSFLGRYRIMDFMMSNFTNSKIDDIQIHIKNFPRSVIEHVQNTNYNINSKRGKILLLHGEKPMLSDFYNNDIASFTANMQYIEDSKEEYVIIAPSHFVYIQDFSEMLKHHIENGNDITMLYQSCNNAKENFVMCDTLSLDANKYVTASSKNLGKYKNRDISLECYCMSKNLFIELVEKASTISSLYWFKDIIAESLKDFKVQGYQHHGYAACINSLKAYYDVSMEIHCKKQLDEMISEEWPIYTMTNDSCPTLYKDGGTAVNSIIGNGCIIEGNVVNSVIGRGVKIKKGSTIVDSVILPGACIGKDVMIENAVVDRYATVTHVKEITGTKEKPAYVKRRDRI